MSILTGKRIADALDTEDIIITPFVKEQLNPNSYDLTLGSKVAIYTHWVAYDPFNHDHTDGSNLRVRDTLYDIAEPPQIQQYEISDKGWVLKPGIGYLMHTAERITSCKYVPVLDGKSSVGRLFIKVHETAGYGDIGFDGQYTLEVTAQHPVRIYAGIRFCQIRFHETVGRVVDYKTQGNYVGAASMGPVPSKLWKQFKGK